MIKFNKEYFNIYDTLSCGQVFRYRPFRDGFLLQSRGNACFMHYEGEKVIIESDDDEYFYNYFDLDCDYSKIFKKALSYNIPYLTESATLGKGIRILKQDREETFFSFLTSQNNNIPRIKRSIEGLCANLGKEFNFLGERLYAFPRAQTISEQSQDFFKSLGLGYRASYFEETSKLLSKKVLDDLENLDYANLSKVLMGYKGVGKKVADCIALFAYHKTDSFPVDTWMEKVYREHFNGELTDRAKISKYFTDLFGEYSGFIQQYMFFNKRGR